MSAIEHSREHTVEAPPKRAPMSQSGRDLAGAYARCFGGTEDGKRVLADLRAKFGHERPRFPWGERPDHVQAAKIDGQCDVLRDIEAACAAGKTFVHTGPVNP